MLSGENGSRGDRPVDKPSGAIILFEVSLFESCHDRQPQTLETTWGDFIDLMEFAAARPAERSQKTSVMAFTPSTYRAGASRAKANVDRVSMIALDIDDGGSTATQMANRLAAHDLAFIIHSTTKSTLDHNRYRIILPLAQPICGERYPHLFTAARQALDGLPDRACSDASRLNILPRLWTGQPDGSTDWDEGQAHHALLSRHGAPLDAERLIRRFPAPPEPSVATVAVTSPLYRLDADEEWSRYVTPRMVEAYSTAQPGGRLFRFMAAVATRAIGKGLPIDANLLADLAQTMNANGPQPSRRTGLRREAQRALNHAAQYVAAQPAQPSRQAYWLSRLNPINPYGDL